MSKQIDFSFLNDGDRVFIHGGAATPLSLLREFVHGTREIQNLELMNLHLEGSPAVFHDEVRNHYKFSQFFVGENARAFLNSQNFDYVPCFLSEIPTLFRNGKKKPKLSLIHVSPPDQHGFCSLGVSVDIAKAAVEVSDFVIAQVNPRMPRIFGDALISFRDIDQWIEVDDDLPVHETRAPNQIENRIGQYIASLVEDGSTLQAGIGAIPDAALAALSSHRHLGVHSEMWSDGMLSLIESGAIDNSQKKVHPGRTISGFLRGSKKLYDYVNNNPSVMQFDISYVNNPSVIARNPKVVAINSAVEIDLSGQICADSIGPRIISGVGGQMDFIRGAALSEGGKPIIAVTSRTKNGVSRIVSSLKLGGGVVTTRSHAHWVVTENGVVDLSGLSIGERAQALIRLAHPDDRERLSEEFWNLRRRSNR